MQFCPLQNCAKLVQSYNYGLEGSSKALEIQSDGFALVALPDGRWATTERSGRVSVVGEVLQTPGVRTAALPNGRMATGSANGIVRIWDLDTKECRCARCQMANSRLVRTTARCECGIWRPARAGRSHLA